MNTDFLTYKLQLDGLAVFSALKKDPVVSGLRRLFEELADPRTLSDQVSIYADVLSAMYPVSSDLSEYIRRLVLADDNFYVRAVASGDPMSEEIRETVRHELNVLQNLSTLSCKSVCDAIGYDGALPAWTNSTVSILGDFMEKLQRLPVTGYGIFASSRFFRIDGDRIVPVPHPDVQPLSELFGYEQQREMVMRNTEALLSGEGASDILLYGDAGTGKSSTIKAVAWAYADRGLRLIEVKKDQLDRIPAIMEELALHPLKFILFIDDLSFSGNDDHFSALKATLEGSVAGCGENTVIYASSNRRHLVRETMSGREGDELHVNDTLQETMSLAARFGLTITFQKPDKEEYLRIVRSLADLHGIDMPEEELFRKAEAHALRKNGRSPRTARQFVELLNIGL